jgi:type II secretory pathway pseudopilin PulG
MSRRVTTALGRLIDDVRARSRALRRDEDGFILLESILAISLITVLMAALATFTINSVQATNELRARQSAAQLATSTMAVVDAMPATDLLTGRDEEGVEKQFDRATPAVATWLTSGAFRTVYDGSATGTGATATISTSTQTQVLNNITFSVDTYIGRCIVRPSVSSDCVTPAGAECSTTLTSATCHLRAVVGVTWKGNGCGPPICSYATATLVNTNDDPIFNTNRATPPVKPIVVDPGNQKDTVGSVVSLQLEVEDDTGVPPFTWQLSSGTLPAGLTLSASGLFTGSPTTVNVATPLTVRVIDAFGRAGLDSFTWTVVAAPTVTTPAAQSTPVGTAVNLAVASTCPNTPCRFTLANAPAGLAINANTGVITGTPTTAGISASVTVTITDADNIATTTPAFTWTVTAAATIGSPGNRGVTELRNESVAIPYTCPGASAATPCTITLANAVPGVGLTTNAAATGNTAATPLSVTTPSGTVYLAGTVQATAVTTGTSRVYTPLTVTITKGAVTASASGTWTAYVPPTVGAVGNRNATVGTTKDIPIAWTCPFAPCTLTLANTIPGLGLSATAGGTTTNNTTTLLVSGTSGTVYISGRVGATAVPTGTSKVYAVTLTITDSDTAPASSTGTWTATNAPNITNPGSQAAEPSQTVTVQMAADCPNGGCQWAADVFVFGSWVSIPISSTGRITYSNAPAGSYIVRVTVTDSDGITDQVTYPLYVQDFTITTPGAQSTPRNTTATLAMASRVSPAADGYTYTISGNPAWITINPDTGLITAVAPSAATFNYSIRVTATSKASSTSLVQTNLFTWKAS